MDTGLLNYELVRPGLLSKLVCLDEIGSTNEFASAHSFPSDTLIVTTNQTCGKGRFGRKWFSDPGKNIAMTLVRNYSLGIDEIHCVSFYSSLILLKSLVKICGSSAKDFSLKWPNDLLLKGKKVSGFLLDTKDLRSAEKKISVGLGINVNQELFDEEIKHKATSLLLDAGKEFDTDEIIIRFVTDFYATLHLINDHTSLMLQWKDNCGHIGKKIMFRLLADGEEYPALVKDILPDGSLRLQLEDGNEKSFYSGEVSVAY